MRIAAGTRLAHYIIGRPLGAGGMGEVYRATDSRLGRDVAIKVLPEHLAQDGDAGARFAREAKAVAALSHPNILAIHDVGSEGGTTFAVMELLDGSTLRDRLRGSPLPWSKAVPIALQVAEGLAAAHARGIVHRDLKPENIFLTSSGQAKILDFGLARFEGSTIEPSDATTDSLTMPGTLLGTVGYMSPEQIRGEPTGLATDIFSFGCVLYEMLAGQPPFARSASAETLAAALRDEPAPLTDRGVQVPQPLEAIVLHCLEKQPADRFQSASDMAFALRAVSSGSWASGRSLMSTEPMTPPLKRRDLWRLATGVVLGVLALVVGLGIAWRVSAPEPVPQSQARLAIVLPNGTSIAPNESPVAGSNLAISRDGRTLAFVARSDRGRRIVVRALDQVDEKELAGTEGAVSPVFSPDGRWLAFFTLTSLKKIPVEGGTPSIICLTPPVTRGATWADNGTIYFSPSFSSGINGVDSGGGRPKVVTTADLKAAESNHLLPEALPGGRALLFTVWKGGDFSAASIWAVRLQTGERKLVLESASAARFMPPGYLMFSRAGALFAMRFDPDGLQVSGEAVPMVDRVWTDRRTGSAHYALAANGTLTYVAGGDTVEPRHLVWLDRQGRSEPVSAPPNLYMTLKLSPDGRRVALEAFNDIWVYDLVERKLERISFHGVNELPVWTPDGRRVTFSSSAGASEPRLYWNAIESGGQPEALTPEGGVQFPASWAPDGKTLAYAETAGAPTEAPTGWDIWLWRPGSPPSRTPFIQKQFNEDQPMFSPSGRALAYVSDESGQRQVYLRAFPDTGRQVRISPDGGTEPVWSRQGGELFYRWERRFFAVRMTGLESPVPGPPTLMFEYDAVVGSIVPGAPSYDVTPDAKRFIMIARASEALQINRVDVALGWTQELDRRLRPAAIR
jgi:serine/threonine protein kinase/Tol biopolymer transport system component